MASKHLAIYLNDHLAAAQGALELLTHLASAHSGTPVGDFLTQLHSDIEMDRQSLEQLMERLQITISTPRRVSGWLAEKVAFVKLQIDDKGSGTLRLFEGLDALLVGIEGKRGLWRALAAATETVPELHGSDYDYLAQRAELQRSRVDAIRLDVAKEALVATD